MGIQTIQGGWQSKPANAVVTVKAKAPLWSGGLADGDYFHVLPEGVALEWPAVQGRRYFSTVEKLVEDCGTIYVWQPADPTAQAVVAAWPDRIISGKPAAKVA